MSNKWTSRSTTGNSTQYRSFYLNIISRIQILTNGLHNIGSCNKGIHNLWIHNQINITLTITNLRISQAVELFWQWTQRLGQHIKVVNTDSNLSTTSTEYMALNTNNITNIQQLKLGIFFLTQNIQLEINLNAAAAIHQYGEACLAMTTNSHQTASNGDFLGAFLLTLQMAKLLQYILSMMRNLKAVAKRSHTLSLKGSQLVPANLHQFIHILFNRSIFLVF